MICTDSGSRVSEIGEVHVVSSIIVEDMHDSVTRVLCAMHLMVSNWLEL